MDISDSKTRELGGRKFKIVKNGLDQAEVSSFISALTRQNNELASKLEHLSALTKFAESTVVEAEKQAKSTRMQAEKEAKAQAASIIATAEEQAKSEVDKIIAESKQRAQEVAQTRVALAERQAQEVLKEAEKRAESIKTNASDQANKIIVEAEQSAVAREQKAQEMLKAAEEKAESIKVNGEKEASKIVAEAKEKAEDLVKARAISAEKEAQSKLEAARDKAEEEARLIKQKSEQILKRSRRIAEDEIKEKLKKVHQGLLSSLEEIEETTVIPTEEGQGTEPVKPEPVVHAKGARITKESQTQPPLPEEEVVIKESPDIYEGNVDVVIPPPLGLDRMLQILKHLRNMPDIEVLNLGVSADKAITIRVSLENPTPLRKVLEGLPEVEKAADAPQDAEVTLSTKKTRGGAPVRRIIVTTRKRTK